MSRGLSRDEAERSTYHELLWVSAIAADMAPRTDDGPRDATQGDIRKLLG